MSFEVASKKNDLVTATAIQGVADVSKEVITQIGTILTAVLDAGKSNPLIGGATVLWINGLLTLIKDRNGNQAIPTTVTNSVTAIVLASFGISAIGEIVDMITGKTANADLVKPSLNTLVAGQGAGPQDLTALLPLLTKALAVA